MVGWIGMKFVMYPSLLSGELSQAFSLQARKWFKFDYGVHQKWMGGMKLGTLVYEKSGKSKSSIGPFVGTIRLKVPGTL